MVLLKLAALLRIADALDRSHAQRIRSMVLRPEAGRLRIITPGVQKAADMGFAADGPFPADTAFVRAIRASGGYDGVVTMYHDQGQIAMKLMGFEQGVTVHGGLPCPITTPAHGTAYDIAGQGVANPQAMCNAFDLAARMASSRRQPLSPQKETLS